MTDVSCSTATIDLSIYSMDAVLKSSYRFTARWHIGLEKRTENTVQITIRPKFEGDDPVRGLRDFQNDLIDQRLRATIAAETMGIRDLIMAHALSSTTLVRDSVHADASKAGPNI